MAEGRFSVSQELTTSPERIRVQVAQTFSSITEQAEGNPRSVTPGTSKNYFEFCQLLKQALDDYQKDEKFKIDTSWESPDSDAVTEVISISLVNREPGAFSQGAPFQGDVKNLRPILRESKADPQVPGYRKVILGKYFDNLVKFTCWARTNKEAISRSFWFEQFVEKYTWYFKISGVQRVMFWKQDPDLLIDNDGKKLYGRPLLFFVRTEELTEYSEKEIEEIYINLLVKK
jgi:hypothetical protein